MNQIKADYCSALHRAPCAVRLSLCMIVRNEERNLPLCLAGVRSVVDEIVIVDTGSEDGTVEVAESFGARVFSFPWIDDFSAARNESLRHARGDFILWLDADDRVPAESARGLLQLKQALPGERNLAYALLVECRGRRGESMVYYQLRILPRVPGVEFRGRIHEDVASSLGEMGLRIIRKGITIVHSGYEDPEQARSKALRNIQILKGPGTITRLSPREHYHLAKSYFGIQDYPCCLTHLLAAREAGRGTPFYKESITILADTYLQLQQGEHAIGALRRAVEEFPESPYFLFLLGGALTLQGRYVEAVRSLDEFTRLPSPIEDFPVPANIQGRLLYFMGRCFEGLGRGDQAIETYRKAFESAPCDRDAMRSLAFLLCRLQRFEEALSMFRKLKNELSSMDKAVDLAMASICLSLGKREDARRLYQEILEQDPRDEEALLGMEKEGECALPLIAWEGTQFFHHSLAIVNREISLALLRSGECRLTIIPYEKDRFGVEEDPERFTLIQAQVHRYPNQGADFHVRHQWPPCFSPPPAGYWIIMQPWEFGSMPSSWFPHFKNDVDEIWVYTDFLRECYINDGMDPERVAVIPLAVDHGRFNPEAPALDRIKEWTFRKFKFLFVGGTIWRKGADILLDAYCRAFSKEDDVALIIKDMGSDSFYLGQDMGETIRRLQADPDAPEIVHATEVVPDREMPGLFRACDCLVQPYRGEGFGMPIAEAMACGLPVIIPRGGAADDFTSGDTAYYVPARWMKVKLAEETVRDPMVLEVDAGQLAHTMRHVFFHRDEARAKGLDGSARVRSLLSWDHSARIILERLRLLRQKPVRRFQGPGLSVSKGSAEDGKDRAVACNRQGLESCASGNPERGEFHFLASIEKDPDNAEAHNNLAVLYYEKGRLLESVHHLSEALKTDPGNPDAQANLEAMNEHLGGAAG
ncbi:MAG: tetratricopeptide repeat protein [Thermodesulfobacteriota bacterium]